MKNNYERNTNSDLCKKRWMKKLTEICNIQYGYAFDSGCFTEKCSYPPLIRIRDVKRGFSETYYSGEYSKEYVVHAGDLLIGMDGEFNIARWKSVDGLLNQRVCKLTAKEGTDEEYLRFALVKALKIIENKTAFVTVKHLSAKELNKLELDLPCIEKQSLRAKILTKLERIIWHRENELRELDNLIRARFVEMFGDISTGHYKYETQKLGEVAEVGSSHRVFTTEFVDEGIPFYRGTEIGELANGQKPSDPYCISEEHYNRLANDSTKPKVGDLLMPSICNKGQVWMVDTEEPFYYKDGRVLCISPNREIYDSRYLQYFMRVKTEVEYPKMGSGSTFAEFKIFLLKDFDVLTPPKDIQEAFADFVKQVNKSKVILPKSSFNVII